MKERQGRHPVKVTYVRSQLDSQPDNVKKEIDPGFINDQYCWFSPFMPLDTGPPVEDKGQQKLPTGRVSQGTS